MPSRRLRPEAYLRSSIAKAIDRYIELRSEEHSGLSKEKIDSRLQLIIEGIFKRCISEGEFKQVGLFTVTLEVISYVCYLGYWYCA